MGFRERAKQTTRRLRRDAHMLWLAARDSRTPLPAKLVAGFVAAYALSPIDLIPDFVPVLGLLDELVIVPLGLMLAIRLVPRPLMEEFRAQAEDAIEQPVSRTGAILVVLVWATVGTFAALQIWALKYW